MIYRNYTVKIPEKARAYANGRVNIETNPVKKNRRIIGWSCGEGLMHPTELYFRLFPQEWKSQYPHLSPMIHQPYIGIGLYALTLGIGMKTGLYHALVEVYGPAIANGIMDYAMYNLVSSFNCLSSFKVFMNNQMMFSIMPYEDSWYSNLFENKMEEQKNNIFRYLWIYACIHNGLKEVYISIDGTNMDYVGTDNELAQKGHSKTGNDKTIISCIWVVCANGERCGLPLTYFVTDGNVVDSKAVKKVLILLQKFNLHVLGVLADRGFCAEDVFNMLHDAEIDYVIMLKENTLGYRDMMSQYAETIREKVEYVLKDGTKYGVVGNNMKILKNLKFVANITLVYDAMNGCSRRQTLMKEVCSEINHLNDTIKENGKGAADSNSISRKVRAYITFDKNGAAVLDGSKLQEEIDSKGYYALGTSLSLSAKEIDETYNLRDSSEKVFESLKTSQGFSTIRSHKRPGVMNRIFAAFIGSILRSEIKNSCKRHELVTNKIIIETSRLCYSYVYNQYDYDTSLSEKLGDVFSDFDLNDDSIKSAFDVIQMRYDAEEGEKYTQSERTILRKKRKCYNDSYWPNNNIGSIPEFSADLDDYEEDGTLIAEKGSLPNSTEIYENENEKSEETSHKEEVDNHSEVKEPTKRGRKPKPKIEQPKGPGRGRKKGSKNKKTLEKEHLISEGLITIKPKKSVGRPKKPETLAREKHWEQVKALARERGIELPEKRPVGHPTSLIQEIEFDLAERA